MNRMLASLSREWMSSAPEISSFQLSWQTFSFCVLNRLSLFHASSPRDRYTSKQLWVSTSTRSLIDHYRKSRRRRWQKLWSRQRKHIKHKNLPHWILLLQFNHKINIYYTSLSLNESFPICALNSHRWRRERRFFIMKEIWFGGITRWMALNNGSEE